MNFRLVLLSITAIIASVTSGAYGGVENMIPSKDGIHFTGDNIDIKDAISLSNSVFVGTLKNLGKLDFRGKGTIAYDMATTVVSKVYLGSIQSPVKLNIRVRNNNMLTETAPSLGEPYIFIISQKHTHNYLIKLLPASDNNIARVQALIAAAPTGQ